MMTACNHEPRLHLLHDGELPVEEATVLEQHVRDCPDCAAELCRLRALSALLTGAGAPTLSPGTAAGIRAAVAARDSRYFETVRLLRRLTAAAAVVLLGASTLLLQRPGRPPSARRGEGVVFVWDRAAGGRDRVAPQTGGEQTQLAQWIVNDLARQATTPVTP